MALPSLTLRLVKGSPLTLAEMDTNLTNLQQAKITITTGSGVASLNLNDTFTISAGTGIAVNLNTTTNNLTITNLGIAVTTATTTTAGIVKIGSGISITGDGTISVSSSSLPIATTSTLGGVKPGGAIQVNTSTGEMSFSTSSLILTTMTITEVLAFTGTNAIVMVGNSDEDGLGTISYTKNMPAYWTGSAWKYIYNLSNVTEPVTTIWPDVIQLNHFDDNLTDSKGYATFTIGNGTFSSSTKKFGTHAFGSESDSNWATWSNSNLADIGTGDFTMECWLYQTSNAGTSGCIMQLASSFTWGFNSGGNLKAWIFDGVGFYTSAGTMSLNTWNHIALVRNGQNLDFYLNGVKDSIKSNSTYNINMTSSLSLGYNQYGDGTYGWIDDFRIAKRAVYTANFTPPTEAFPNS